jgi:hypothetical protein
VSPVERLYLAGLLTEAELGAAAVYTMAARRRGQQGRIGTLQQEIDDHLAAHGIAEYGGAMLRRLCARDELPHALEHWLAGDRSGRGQRDLDVLRTALGLVAEVGRALRIG